MKEALEPQVHDLIWEGRVKNPDYYLNIWLGCRRWSTASHQIMPRAGGWEDQEIDVLLAFEVIEELVKVETQAKETFERIREGKPNDIAPLGCHVGS